MTDTTEINLSDEAKLIIDKLTKLADIERAKLIKSIRLIKIRMLIYRRKAKEAQSEKRREYLKKTILATEAELIEAGRDVFAKEDAIIAERDRMISYLLQTWSSLMPISQKSE
jgi:hypothetical protein